MPNYSKLPKNPFCISPRFKEIADRVSEESRLIITKLWHPKQRACEKKVLLSLALYATSSEIEKCFHLYLTNPQKFDSHSLVYYTSRFGSAEGLIRYNAELDKNSSRGKQTWKTRSVDPLKHPGFPEYWSDRFNISLDEAAQYISTSSRDRICKTHATIKDRGGQKKIRVDKAVLSGISRDEAERRFDESQSRGLKYFANKYGVDEGLDRWKKRQVRWWASFQNARNSQGLSYSSTQERNIVLWLASELGLESSDYLSALTRDQLLLLNPTSNRFYAYDFCVPRWKLIVEYNGIKFHASPKVPETSRDQWRKLFTNETYSEVEKRDLHKRNCAEHHEYTVFAIWEDDSEQDKLVTLEAIRKYVDGRNSRDSTDRTIAATRL